MPQLMGDGRHGGGIAGRRWQRLGPAGAGAGESGSRGEPTGPVSRAFEVKRYDFVVQFCWQPKTRAAAPRSGRRADWRAEAEAAAAKEAAGRGRGRRSKPPAQ